MAIQASNSAALATPSPITVVCNGFCWKGILPEPSDPNAAAKFFVPLVEDDPYPAVTEDGRAEGIVQLELVKAM